MGFGRVDCAIFCNFLSKFRATWRNYLSNCACFAQFVSFPIAIAHFAIFAVPYTFRTAVQPHLYLSVLQCGVCAILKPRACREVQTDSQQLLCVDAFDGELVCEYKFDKPEAPTSDIRGMPTPCFSPDSEYASGQL